MLAIPSLRRPQLAAWLGVLFTAVAACGGDKGATDPGSEPEEGRPSGLRGTITLAKATTVANGPDLVVDVDLASGRVTQGLNGLDPHRSPTGETAFLARLEAGAFANHAVVVADARGVPGVPLYLCEEYSYTSSRNCHTPRLSPNRQLVAFGTAGTGGNLCQSAPDFFWADYVVIRDRNGAEVSRFEGFYYPDWLPDGRLLMMGSPCRGAGVWVTDATLRTATRVDGRQLTTPAHNPSVSPDGSRALFVWNGQLWTLTLDGQGTLTRVTAFERAVESGGWSPDGTAIAVILFGDAGVTLPSLGILRPGSEEAQVVQLPFRPHGPISWR
jgi:hypothetical protein